MEPWRLWLLTRRTVGGFSDSGGTRLAAAIAYYALLSLFPLVIALVSGVGLVLSDDQARREVIDPIIGALPLSADGAADLRGILEGAVGREAGAVGLIGLAGLLWTASGMMGAIRAGLTTVTGADGTRPFLRAKLVDLAMVVVTGTVLLVSTTVTVVMRVADDRVLEPLGLSGPAGAVIGIATPIALGFVVLTALLRLVPAEPIPWAGVWRGALGGAVGLWVLTTGFGIYVRNFGRYNAVYGSLGAVVAFLVFVFLAAILLLIAAAAASRWPAVATAGRPRSDGGDASRAEAIRRALTGLVSRG